MAGLSVRPSSASPSRLPEYFWGRLSATSVVPYNSAVSSGSNLGPTNPALIDEVNARVDALHAADPSNTRPIPVDLVTSSGSGLDPDISVASANYQIPRIARERNLTESDVAALVAQQTQDKQFGLFGEPRVNVLKLNLALDDHECTSHHRNASDRIAGWPLVTHLRSEDVGLGPADPLFCDSCCPDRPGRRVHGKGIFR